MGYEEGDKHSSKESIGGKRDCCSSKEDCLYILFRGKHEAIPIYNKKIKVISNQLDSSYTYSGIEVNSDSSAWFLICTSPHITTRLIPFRGEEGELHGHVTLQGLQQILTHVVFAYID